MNCGENPFKMGMFLQLEVSFKMGAFSDTQHTHLGIFILESPGLGDSNMKMPLMDLWPLTPKINRAKRPFPKYRNGPINRPGAY